MPYTYDADQQDGLQKNSSQNPNPFGTILIVIFIITVIVGVGLWVINNWNLFLP